MISKLDAEMRMAEKLEERKNIQSLRKLTPSDSQLVDFCSNDYLGLARNIELLESVEQEWKKLKELGTSQLIGSGGSRLLAGDSNYASLLELQLAIFYKSESALLFNSGYTANLALFSAIPRRGDVILYDHLIHASTRDGIKMSNAKSWSFNHNDLFHLEELLKKAEGMVYVAAEAIYSMDGDECPLNEMILLCEKYGAAFILDEAHSNGLFGERGEGLSVSKNIESRIFARLLTFGKAVGCHGAVIVGSKLLRDYLVNFARPFIYTTALPIHDLVVIKMAIENIAIQTNLRQQLALLVTYFQEQSIQYPAINLLNSNSAIQGIMVRGNENAFRIATACRVGGYDVRSIIAPTVQEGEERLRVVIHAFNSYAEIDELLEIVAAVS